MSQFKDIDAFLDAIAKVHGEEYRDKMVVKAIGTSHVKVKYPDEATGRLVRHGFLDLMTKDLHDHPDLHAAHH